MHALDLIEVERAVGYRYEAGGELEHYQWICPPCRRALVAIAQGRSWGRETVFATTGLPAPSPRYVNPGLGSGPLGAEDRDNFHP
jgi:hypothetical protein